MVKELLVLALAALCFAQAAQVQSYTADVDFLQKQKKIYELFFYIEQPKFTGAEWYEVGHTYDIESNIEMYENKMVVREFLYRFKLGMLRKGALFSLYYEEHRDELVVLFKLFYYAKDFATFYKTAAWARYYLNGGMFVTALTSAVMFRHDTKHIVLPPMYEVYPYLFFSNEVIQDTYRYKMYGYNKEVQGADTYLIKNNYTYYYMNEYLNKEFELDYYYNDVGLNNYYYYVRNIFPFWISLNNIDVPKNIRGEFYYYVHQQLLARYYLERLSHGYGEIDEFDYYKKYAPGYFSTLVYGNGISQPSRYYGSELPYYKYKYVKESEGIEQRILAAIDSGFIYDTAGKQYNLYTPEGFNYLGNLIEGNYDSCNTRFYGAIDALYRDIFGVYYDCKHKNCFVPSSLQLFSTSLRDPAFYTLYKKIIGFFYRYKCNLPSYTRSELDFSGVAIEGVDVDKLYTFFEGYDYYINNAVAVNSIKDGFNFKVKTKQYRLNYKPFTYHINVKSNINGKGIVRIFMGPSYNDKYFKVQNYFFYNSYDFVELDKFMVDLKVGMNSIERHSTDSAFTAKDFPGSDYFYEKLMSSVGGSEPFTYTDKLYDFPQNLYLPRGRVGGYPFKFFFGIFPVDESKVTYYNFPIIGKMLYDGKPFGFPLDKPMYPWYYDLKNFYFKDVYVYYMQDNAEYYGNQNFQGESYSQDKYYNEKYHDDKYYQDKYYDPKYGKFYGKDKYFEGYGKAAY